MPILDLQKRSRTLGRIRLGQKGDRGQPQKLDRFRLTSASEPLLNKVAELYGGEVHPWTPAGGSPAFEVITDSRRLPIMVPPQPVTQWFEAWRKSGCVHRCDGRTNVLTDEPCDPEDALHQEATEKPTTRLNVVLRDVEGVGVWRVETKGWNAAAELPDVAEFLAQAGGYVDGWLALEQRTSVDNSGSKAVTRHFMVPIIEIDVTPAQLMAGRGRVAAPVLTGGPVGDRPALAAAGPDYVALAADATTVEEVRGLWTRANDAGHLTQGLDEHLKRRAHEITASGAPQAGAAARVEEPQPDAEGVADAVVVDEDADAVWQQIVLEAGRQGMTASQLQDDFPARMGGLIPDDASAGELRHYLGLLQGGTGAAA
ncbi:hypothetical protein [Nocardioides soli]|uniref:Uncharacterized protein n=1 Tax=Nocardioides soli TaxID=1036020 RepID=A0A7W4VSV0_9ACTN|nr:hypothetical protein [Nocardioides soli]MBB3041182.1 hypothetical protein [Nocardioides soli]